MTLPDSLTYPKPPGQERPYPKPRETAYEIYGDLESDKIPLIALHGGPGFSHSYLHPLALLLTDYGIPVVLYDQIGCGESARYQDRMGDGPLWTPELFMAELDNLRQALGVKAFDLLGHSWGGMLVAQYTARVQPAAMPVGIQEIMTQCENDGKTETPEYEAATNEFNKRHSCQLDPIPRELARSVQALMEDPTVEMTMFGPNDFDVTGSLKNWGVDEDLKNLTPEVVPGGILLMNGYFDVAQDEGMVLFFKEPSAKVKWVRFGLSSHCPHLEETEKFVRAVGSFLDDWFGSLSATD